MKEYLDQILADLKATWAKKPISSLGDELKFVKIFTDTLFSVANGKVSPLFKLDLGKKIPSKETISQLGPFPGNPDYLAFIRGNKYLSNIDRIYETSDYIVLIPHQDYIEGYYWIDKKTNNGFHVDVTSLLDADVNEVVAGRSIMDIWGSSEDELISCFNADIIVDSFKKAFNSENGNLIFPENVVNTIENVDPDGNPFLIIYSH